MIMVWVACGRTPACGGGGGRARGTSTHAPTLRPLNHPQPTIPSLDSPDALTAFAIELLWTIGRGAIPPDTAPRALAAAGVAVADASAHVSPSLATAAWAVWSQLEAAADVDGEEAGAAVAASVAASLPRVSAAVAALLASTLLHRGDVLRASDGALASECGATDAPPDAWRRREARSNTRALYTQHKFNLAREDGEGYAKLWTLVHGLSDGADAAAVAAVTAGVATLVGAFDLDPHRACDALLGAVQEAPSTLTPALDTLLTPFSPATIGHALGVRAQRAAVAARGDGGPPPPSDAALWPVAAALVAAGTVPLDVLWPHLTPSDDDAATAGAAASTALKDAAAAVGRISLTDSKPPPDKDGAAAVGLSSARANLDTRPLAVLAAGGEAATSNQKLALLAALVRTPGSAARAATDAVAAGVRASGLEPAAYPPVARALVDRLLVCLADVPAAQPPGAPRSLGSDGGGGPTATTAAADFPPDAVSDALALGVHLFHSPPALTALCRLWSAVVAHNLPPAFSTASPAAKTALATADRLMTTVLMPASSLIPANAAVAACVWTCLAPLPYEDRFRFYAAHRSATTTSPLLSAAAKLAVTEARKVLRRLHAPADKRDRRDALAPFGRMLGKAAAAAPLPIAAAVAAQAEAYPNMADPCVDALRYGGPLTLDALTFVIIDRLASSSRAKLKDDGVNIADWLASLASFAGAACRRYEGVDVRSLAQYVANTLQASEPYDTLVLRELVATLGGVPPLPDLSEGQVAALAGGPVLVDAALALTAMAPKVGGGGGERARSRGASRLASALTRTARDGPLAVPLFILLAQQRVAVATTTDSPHIKLIAELVDKTHDAASQFAAFLARHVSPSALLTAGLPSLDALVVDYGVDPELAFDVWRPLLPLVSEAGAQAAATAAAPAAAAPPTNEDGELADDDANEEGEAPPPGVEAGEVAAKRAPAAASAPPSTAEPPLPSTGPTGVTWPALVDAASRCAPPRVWRALTPSLYAAFWRLTLPDIVFPAAAYATERAKLTAALAAKRRAAATADAERAARARAPCGGGARGRLPTTRAPWRRPPKLRERRR